MCIIIAKEKGIAPLDAAYFDRAWVANSDGFGVIFKKGDEPVRIKKGIMNKEEALAYMELINTEDCSYIAHFRIKSVGSVTPENTHPFVFDKISLAHNGTISHTNFKKIGDKTDSETFGLLFLNDKDIEYVKRNKLILEMALGSSKFAIMDNETGEIFILNKQCGKEEHDCWFSNYSADEKKPYQYNNSNYNKYGTGTGGLFDDDYGYGYSRGTGSYTKSYGKSTYKTKTEITFATKKYNMSYGTYDDKQGCWIYNSTKKPVNSYRYGNSVVTSKNGQMYLLPSLEISEDVPSADYSHDVKLYDALRHLSRTQGQLQSDYHAGGYIEDYDDRNEIENQISAYFTVKEAIKKFKKEGKVINYNSLYYFIMSNITVPTSNIPEGQILYNEFVEIALEEFMVRFNPADTLTLDYEDVYGFKI